MDKLFSDLQNKTNDLANGLAIDPTNDPTNDATENSTNKASEKLLKKQQASTEKLSALLGQSLNALACGPTCQKIKIGEELNQKYLNAQTNMQTAPVQLEATKKNYYVFTEGRPYYDNMLEEELKQKAKLLAKLLADNFKEEILNANTMNSYYNTELTNSSYTKELYAVYLEKNKLIQNTIKNHHADIITNDRKTYYETEALEDLKNWYSFFWYVFYLFIMPLFTFTLIRKTSLHVMLRIIIELIALSYPYYMDPVARSIYGVFHSIWKSLPKNVYNDL
jgi:hypothetical protein